MVMTAAAAANMPDPMGVYSMWGKKIGITVYRKVGFHAMWDKRKDGSEEMYVGV